MRYLSVLVLLAASACSGAADAEGAAASSSPEVGSGRPSATPTPTEEPFTGHDAELLFRETLAEVESVLGDLDITVQAPAPDALAGPADVELNALEVAFDALVRRQEADQERLERRFGRINADADEADRRCGDDPDCLLASVRAYEEATDRFFARADRVAARHDEESDWLIARMEQGGVVTPDPTGGGADPDRSGGTDAAVSQASALQVGDCYDRVSGNVFRDVVVVSCGQPHDLEVVAVAMVPFSVEAAERRCIRAFERRIGQPVGESELSLQVGFPAGADIDDDGRKLVVCSVAAPDGPLRGAVPGPR